MLQATRRLSLKQLELLLALASAETIAGAGLKLGMSASATSHAIRALETSLGTAVLDRNAPGVVLSYAGLQILPHVRDVFAAMRLVQNVASASAGLKTGLLRLGSFGASSSLKLLPPIVEAFRERYPGVDVYITERSDDEMEQEIIERRIEIGVLSLPKPALDTHLLAVDELVAVLPRHHPLARKAAAVSLKDLAAFPLVMTHAGSQGLINRMYSRAGIEPKVTHELSQLVSIAEFVARGHGVSILASLAVPEHPGIVCRKLTPKSTRRAGLACLDEKKLSPAAHAFWQLARKFSGNKSPP
jgi:DNA-binding transcriptional LysR family regulator